MIVGNDPILLTPGPLTTSLATKQAMLRDWGSWDAAFNAITASLRRDLVDIVGGGGEYTCVPLQGSGTFSVEAAIGTVVPPASKGGKVLVPNNGAYCARIVRICGYLGRGVVDLPVPEDQPATAAIVEAALAADPSITHVAQVHCETGAGVLNDLAGIAQVCARRGKGLIVDAMSSFAALPIDVATRSVRRPGGCQRQVPRRRSRHGIRHRPEESARGLRRQRPFTGDGPARSVRLHGEDDAVALHAADARRGRAARRGRPVQGSGRTAGAPRALRRKLPHADRRHGRARISSLPEARGAGADHRDLPRAGRSRVRLQGVLRENARARLHPVSRAS